MTAPEACEIIKRAVCAALPNAEVVSLPIADGGEGSALSITGACGGKMINADVCGPYFGEKVSAAYGVLPSGTAVIEVASCAGISLAEGRLSAADTTTYGVGELILHAAESGAKKIFICLGGSATNDGGCGMAAALGARFFCGGAEFVPTGRTLSKIDGIDVSKIKKVLRGVEFFALCDVKNPLYGKDGAAYVFAPQKGVRNGETEMLDAGLRHLAAVLKKDVGKDISNIEGAGAAGGLGGGAAAFLGAKPTSGIERILDVLRFDEHLAGADLVITGEGCADAQSVCGKAVSGVAARATAAGVPVMCVAGKIGDGADALYGIGVTDIVQTSRAGAPFDEIKATCRNDLFRAVKTAVERKFM